MGGPHAGPAPPFGPAQSVCSVCLGGSDGSLTVTDPESQNCNRKVSLSLKHVMPSVTQTLLLDDVELVRETFLRRSSADNCVLLPEFWW